MTDTFCLTKPQIVQNHFRVSSVHIKKKRMTGARAYTRPTTVPKMVTGLVDLVEGMTKEVLRSNPTNVYEFCAAHMQKLLETRDGPTCKQDLTLEQKISRAQDKIKQRARERQQKYDKYMLVLSELGHKDKEIPIENNKPPIPKEMYLTCHKEIEISHCDKLNAIEENVDVINNETSRTDESNINLHINKSESNSVLLDNKITGSTQEGHVDCLIIDLNGGSKRYETPDLKSKIFEKSLDFETSVIGNEKTAVKETGEDLNTSFIKTLDERDKLNIDVPAVRQGNQQDNASLLNNEDSSDGEYYDDDDEKQSTNNIDKDDIMFVETKNPNHKESVSETNIQASINYVTSGGDIHVTDNTIASLNGASTYDKATPGLPLFDKDTIIQTEQDSIAIETYEMSGKNDKTSHICSDVPLTIVNFPKNFTDPAPNDNHETNNMDLETAAITIQKVFRSFLFKSRASNDENSSIDEDIKDTNGYSCPNMSNDRRPMGVTRMDTMLQTVNEEKSLSLSTDDSSTLSSAATIIQAHIRGFLVRSKLNSNKTASTNSILNSEDPMTPRTENEFNHHENKTVLNIHIVPDGNIPSLSRDDSIITSKDLSFDGSPPSSINLHPLGYDKSEPRKQLKREDAVQSISPPSDNSGKHSEDVDSTKEILIDCVISNECSNDKEHGDIITIVPDVPVRNIHNECLINKSKDSIVDPKTDTNNKRNTLKKMGSDEMDVVTPHTEDDKQGVTETNITPKLIHSGELHDVVLPTNVSRGSTSVVRGE